MAAPSNSVSAPDDSAQRKTVAVKSTASMKNGRALRYSISLNGAVNDEAKLIVELTRWPQGRRQHRIRKLIDNGRLALGEGGTYDRFEKSEGGSTRMRVYVHLQPASPDDQQTLDRLEKVSELMRPQWLKEALVVGFLQSSSQSLDIDLTYPDKEVTSKNHNDLPPSLPQSELPNAADATAGHQSVNRTKPELSTAAVCEGNTPTGEVDILLDSTGEIEVAEAQDSSGVGPALRGLFSM
jgi:hypothetical protein